MPAYIYRTHRHATLTYAGREYRDGDRITISQTDALRLAAMGRLHRFEDIAPDPEPTFTPPADPATPVAPKVSTT